MKTNRKSFFNRLTTRHTMQHITMTLLAGTLASTLGITPAIADPGIRNLVVSIKTGSDDLRGGAVSTAQLRLANGRTEPQFNLNNGAQWQNNSTHTVRIPLSRAYNPSELANAQLVIRHDGAGRNFGETYDNWNVQRVTVRTQQVCTGGASLLTRSISKRFTGSSKSALIEFRIPRGFAHVRPNRLTLAIRTGKDDLRSGAVATAQIRLRGGRTLPTVNLNNGAHWGNNSFHTVTLPLPTGVSLGQLESIVIRHDGAGRNFGETYDNWNMSSVSVTSPRSCSVMNLGSVGGNPWKRFSGSNTFASIRLYAR